jgi:hypothetical protein
MDKHETLPAALAAAINEAEAVTKGASNDFHRYRYASAEAVLMEARQCLGKHGLSVVWAARQIDKTRAEVIELAGKRGSQMLTIYGVLTGTLRVLHAHSDGVVDMPVEWPICLESGKHADKAVAAAQTSALSYGLRDLLMLPRVAQGEDIQAREDRPTERAPTPAERPNPRTNHEAVRKVQEHLGGTADDARSVAFEELRAVGVDAQCIEYAFGSSTHEAYSNPNWDKFVADVQSGKATRSSIMGSGNR